MFLFDNSAFMLWYEVLDENAALFQGKLPEISMSRENELLYSDSVEKVDSDHWLLQENPAITVASLGCSTFCEGDFLPHVKFRIYNKIHDSN